MFPSNPCSDIHLSRVSTPTAEPYFRILPHAIPPQKGITSADVMTDNVAMLLTSIIHVATGTVLIVVV